LHGLYGLPPSPLFQSTPPHGGRRSFAASRASTAAVSIHAPARGATRSLVPARIPGVVSIHAPARGATWLCIHRLLGVIRFNPRPRTGGDLMAPATTGRGESFNPRPRTGGDASRPPAGAVHAVSIHAPARGATRLIPAPQPRPEVSIHAPARGATVYTVAVHNFEGKVSIHAPARGATVGLCRDWVDWLGFNPRPRTGGDQKIRPD